MGFSRLSVIATVLSYAVSFVSSSPILSPELLNPRNWNETHPTASRHEVFYKAKHKGFDRAAKPFCGNGSEPPIFTTGDFDDGGPGVIMHDLDYTNRRQPHFYFFYENNQDDHPWKYTVLQPGAQIFISVCPTFAGRIVRGNPAYNLNSSIQHNLGTWVEISWEAPPSTRSWGDVSLLEGCDGAALLASTDGSGVITGFSINILTGAPYAALASKSDGSVVLAKTVGDEANFEATQYELGLLDPTTQAFIVQSYKPVIVTTNGRWDLTVYPGTY